MRGALSVAALAASVLTLALAAARADDKPIDPARHAAFDQRLFGGPIGADKAYACFARRYTAAHLAEHPQQTVRAMKLLVSAEKVPEDASQSYSFHLQFSYRDRKPTYESSGSCSHVAENNGELQFGCGVDCDGGGIAVALSADDKSTLVSLERVRVWQSGKEDDEGGNELVAGADDKSFRLQRVELRDCDALMPEHQKLASRD